jgi:hypothetical protein
MIVCELSPEHGLICSGSANELGELADMGIVDLSCGKTFAKLTPVGEVLYAYVVQARRFENRRKAAEVAP